MKAKLSILGLYTINPNLFNDLELPNSVESDTLTWKILEETAEMEALYPDPDYMQQSIQRWSRSRIESWNRIAETLNTEYNPIWNKDANISETRIYGQQERSSVYGQQQNTTAYGARSTTQNIGARSADNTEQVTGFNSETLETSTKTTATQAAATDSASEVAHTDTLTAGSHTDTLTDKTHTDTITHTEQGNIGVTTSQQMIEAEMKLREQYNIYEIIAAEFKAKFCLMVY